MSKKNDKEFIKKHIHYLESHGMPNSRRDFLASGAMTSAAYIMTPSILGILANSSIAKADDGCNSSVVSLPAFCTIDLAGGASLSGNTIVHDVAGNMLPDYSQLGLGKAPPTEKEFGDVLFPSAAAIPVSFLTGLRSTAAGALTKSSFVQVAVPTRDDTNQNAIDASGMVTQAGLVGSLLPNLGNNNGTGTGTSQMASTIKPPAPLIVSKISDLTSALAPASSLTANLTNSQQKSLLSLVSGLSGSQARTVASANSSSGQTLSKLVQCATGKNIELATATNPGIDPQLDSNTAVSTLWGMATGGNQFGRNQGERQVFGSMAYNALKGNTGAVGMTIGGYDYHGQGRTNQDQKDFEAGQLVGKVLATAQAMGKPIFINITTDGSVGADQGSALRSGFNGDQGSAGMSYMIAYDPTAKPSMKNDRAAHWQLGYYSNGQGAVDNTLVGSPTQAGVATFANYLAFAKQSSLFGKVLSPLSTQDTDYVVRFA